MGTLLFCLHYGKEASDGVGVWDDVITIFGTSAFNALYDVLEQVNTFRNTHVAHIEERLTDSSLARRELMKWLKCIISMREMLEDGYLER